MRYLLRNSGKSVLQSALDARRLLPFAFILMLAFLATTPLYAGLMIFSVKVLRPLFASVEESQGKYSSHQIDAIKGIEAVKAAAAEGSFRDAMLNEFLSVSQKRFKATFIVMSLLSLSVRCVCERPQRSPRAR